MKNLNLTKFLFIPLLCTGISASAQDNSLAGNNAPAAVADASTLVAKTATPSLSFNAKSVLFAQKNAFSNATAAEGSGSAFNFGLEPQVLLPLGDFKNSASIGVGVSLKALYHLNETGAVTGSVGYDYFLAKEDVDYKYAGIPVKIGYLAKFEGFFVEPQVGIYSLRASDDDGNSASSTNLLLGARVGLNVGENSNLGVGYSYIKQTGGSFSFAGLSYFFSF